MKLELKHLAPYLSYGLKIHSMYKVKDSSPIIFEMKTDNIDIVISHDSRKPILRPLSDLVKVIEIDGGMFTPIYHNAFHEDKYNLGEYMNGFSHYKSIKYGIIERLLEWHFDVFGLIEKGIAIDINTLN